MNIGDTSHHFSGSFFTTPKQTERLIEAQKNLRSIQQEDLKPFASATKLFEGSKYATISFMNDVITAIKNGVQSTHQNVEPNIDFTYPTLMMILVLRILMMMMKLMIIQNALFREIYNEKRQELSTIQQQQSLSPDNTINSLLQDIFANRCHRERQDEIDEYIMIEEIDVSICPFKWWASQESQFPILSQKYYDD
ncbi:hypothetical protein GLOIN_2v1880780 [Rhizophagus irregularis DAOM 181602=DAOM 197198]|nr:hypothetical protein GLOIN_2v1880780 [Rhizophagus irregularis DAOM 181602=DAOM 197198]